MFFKSRKLWIGTLCSLASVSYFAQNTSLVKDKSAYMPGEQVIFRTDAQKKNVEIRYYQKDKLLQKQKLVNTSWTWMPPKADYQGYLITLWDTSKNQPLATTAVDVSSDWARFPRYGFLSKYPDMSAEEQQKIIENLKDHHINGIQFYDWHYRHDQPLAGTPVAPWSHWADVGTRIISGKTVAGYIGLAHQYRINAMFYNLNYGALRGYGYNGVTDQMFMYKDRDHKEKDVFKLPVSEFISDIYFTDPANNDWQKYLAEKNNDLYKVYDFDGFHIDQVGDRGEVYDYEGKPVQLGHAFADFIRAMKKARPDKKLVFNAVNQFGQEEMAAAPLDVLYTEVWGPNDSFADLAKVITDNDRFSKYSKKTILAAYMDYENADRKGEFNTPGILLTDAVIMAFGGNHLELGEHMLGKEYFPSDNLAMKPDLVKALRDYYNFQVAYENLLRDGGSFTEIPVTSVQGKVKFNSWPPVKGQVSVLGKRFQKQSVLHFINFTNAGSLEWRDNKGTQTEPAAIEKIPVSITVNGNVKSVWYATPDQMQGMPQTIKFKQKGNQITVEVPYLKYWGMMVID